MKLKSIHLATLFIITISTTFFLGTLFSFTGNQIGQVHAEEKNLTSQPKTSDYEDFILGNFSGHEYSSYNLSVYLDEDTSTITGNLTVDYYNDDPLNFTQLPFHIYPSGMEFKNRPGYLEILNVTTLEDPKEALDYDVYNSTQLMCINLTETLEPGNRTTFIISFNTTLPDGGIDRANEYGWDANRTRIFKFANSYPQPCVYDEYDGWNTDPYLLIGDPFYFDMAYYDFIINAPVNMTIAATGALLENTTIGDRTTHHYNPKLPVREVTFSASRYFEVQSVFAEGANVTVAAYYLEKSAWLWENFALDILGNSGSLFFSAFGNYTYPTLNIVQEFTQHGGMEYPCQVYVSESADRAANPWLYLESAGAHEIAHQWFYNLVGFDQIDWGFLDEGITSWVTDWYKEVFHPDWQIFKPYWILTNYVWHYSLDVGKPNKINQSIPDCLDSGTDYYYTAYRKAPVVLENFRRMMGEETLVYGIRLFTQDNFFGIATLEDFQQALETVAGQSLDWFFLPWFNNPYLPKYNFTNVIYDAQSKTINITIEDVNEDVNPFPYSQLVPIEIYSSGSTLEYNGTKWINSTTSLIIPIENTPTSVVLNYSGNIPVQLSNYSVYYLETTEITIINVPQQAIPSYNILIIIMVFSFFGIIMISKKRRSYYK